MYTPVAYTRETKTEKEEYSLWSEWTRSNDRTHQLVGSVSKLHTWFVLLAVLQQWNLA